MSEELNATCHLCGKRYHRCDQCDKLKHVFTSWKMLTDTQEHFAIFMILRDYGLGKIKKADAAKELQEYNLSDVDTWEDEDNKKLVKEILSANKTEKVEKTTGIKSTEKKAVETK